MAWYYKHEESNNQKWRQKNRKICNVMLNKQKEDSPLFSNVFLRVRHRMYIFVFVFNRSFFLFCWKRFWWNKYKQTPFILLQILLVYPVQGGRVVLMLLLFISLESFVLQLLLLFSCHCPFCISCHPSPPCFIIQPDSMLNWCRPPSLPLRDPPMFVVK